MLTLAILDLFDLKDAARNFYIRRTNFSTRSNFKAALHLARRGPFLQNKYYSPPRGILRDELK